MGFPRLRLIALLAFVLTLLAAGCGVRDSAIFDPAGPVASEQRHLFLRTSAIMLIVVVPVIVMTIWFAWRFRESNTGAPYQPQWSHSLKVELVVWTIPVTIVASVGYHAWVFTHSLDPYEPIPSSSRTVQVRAIAQDWKWLFLYPEQQFAVVNELVFPSNAPLSIEITSDTVMNSFFIPGLGGQIYAMAGMRTQLNLIADKPREFLGRNVQYSGDGFSNQHFSARAVNDEDFRKWIDEVRRSPDTLDGCAYRRLAKPTQAHPVTYFSSYTPGLFARTIAKYDPDAQTDEDTESCPE